MHRVVALVFSVLVQFPGMWLGEEELYCPVGDHERQVDVQIVIIHDPRNDFKLHVMHKKPHQNNLEEKRQI